MRHDFFGADLQMFHLIKHRIENDELRARADDLLDFLCTLRAAPPNRYAGSEIGIFVAPTKPLADAAFGPCFVIVDSEIDSLAVTENRRIPLRVRKELPNHRRFPNESTGRRRTGAHPAATVFHSAFERILVVAAEP